MDPFIGTIMPVGFAFAPKGWALCNGQLLGVQQYQALFSLLGRRFGGDGVNNFALPDLRGRTPRGITAGAGTMRGQEQITLTLAQIPSHSHGLAASTTTGVAARGGTNPVGKLLAVDPVSTNMIYGTPASPVTLSTNNVVAAGGNQGHDNMQPSLVVNYIIALTGLYPSQT